MAKLEAREIGRHFKAPNAPQSDKEYGLDHVFKTGQMGGLALWEVIDKSPKWVRALIDNTDFILDNEAYARLREVEDGR